MEALVRSQLVEEIKKQVREAMELESQPNDQEIRDQIEQAVFQLEKRVYLKLSEKQELIETVFNGLRRLDILQPLLENQEITEIMVNGTEGIFIEEKGRARRLEESFASREKLEHVIQSIVSKVNRAVNEASPIVDARLQDGSRVNVVLPPIAINGPILTIRKFPAHPITMEDLVRFGSLTEEAAAFLQDLVKARYNILVCGGTGSGKTTFLNVLSNFIPAHERIITIEDSAELQIRQVENLVKLETRNANTEGRGAVSIRDLIRASLRMRPDRIIVGEVRGAEAIDMLQAMNTGHDGSLSTGHANTPRDMLSRLETMILSGMQLPLEAVRQQIASGIDLLVHLSRLRDHSKGVMEITEVSGYQAGELQLNPLFVRSLSKEDPRGRLVRTENSLCYTDKLRLAGL